VASLTNPRIGRRARRTAAGQSPEPGLTKKRPTRTLQRVSFSFATTTTTTTATNIGGSGLVRVVS
jgi:hypothetical protein